MAAKKADNAKASANKAKQDCRINKAYPSGSAMLGQRLGHDTRAAIT